MGHSDTGGDVIPRRVAVWGTGNVGRPAIRAVVAHAELELAEVIVFDPAKLGLDAGDLCFSDRTGVVATNDRSVALSGDIDTVVYTATGDTRPDEALADICDCLRSGADVVSTSLYPMLHPPSAPAEVRDPIAAACKAGNSSLFVSGIDPGWTLDILPTLVSGVCAGITEIRIREIFNYALYDQPDVVREIIGFGSSMDETPLMLFDFSLEMVWAPMLRVLADMLGLEIDQIATSVEKRPLDRTIDVPGMGVFDEGTQGAFRFEVVATVAGRPLLVVEHVTRIDDNCAPDWPASRLPGGEHCVLVSRPPSSRSDRARHRDGRAGRGWGRQRVGGQPDRQRHPRGGGRAGRAAQFGRLARGVGSSSDQPGPVGCGAAPPPGVSI